MIQVGNDVVATVARRWAIKPNASTVWRRWLLLCASTVWRRWLLLGASTVWRRWLLLGASTVWRRWLLMFVSILMSSGCTYSTNPIFVEQDNLFDEAFLGTWEADKEAKFEFRRFEVNRWGPEEKSYRAVLRNETGEKQEPSFQLFLSQIDGKKFITAKFEKPSSEKANPDTPAAAYLTFAIDRCEDREIETRYLRADWLAGQVKRNPSILKHEWHARPGNKEKSDLRLTASTPELRAFVLEQLGKREAWMPVTFKKIR